MDALLDQYVRRALDGMTDEQMRRVARLRPDDLVLALGPEVDDLDESAIDRLRERIVQACRERTGFRAA